MQTEWTSKIHYNVTPLVPHKSNRNIGRLRSFSLHSTITEYSYALKCEESALDNTHINI